LNSIQGLFLCAKFCVGVVTSLCTNIGATGNEYYFGFIQNAINSGTISIILTTTGSQSVHYSIQAPGVGYSHNGTVTTSAESVITLPNSLQVSSYSDQHKGIYLTTSSDQITVMGQSYRQHSSDSFLILPLTKQNVEEYVYYGMSVAFSFTGLDSATLIVGTKDNTILTLMATQLVTIQVGSDTSNLFPGKNYSFAINRLQTLYIGSYQDITGTKIITNQPVSVFSGHECAYVPVNVAACDLLVEQIPSTIIWGKVYYVASLATKSRSTIRILAAYDHTDVDIYCNNVKASHTINQGRFVERIIGQENCAIYANKEVLVAQFGHGGTEDNDVGDPMMMLVPATMQYFNKFTFSTFHGTSSHYVNIIVLAQYYQPNMISLITGGVNISLNTQQWTPVKVNNISVAYTTQVNVQEGVVKILHTNMKALMTTVVYGFHSYEGYGHPGGYHDITGTTLIKLKF